MAETRTIREVFVHRAEAAGLTPDEWLESAASRTHPRRLLTLSELADAAVFMASGQASGFTGTTVNLTMGTLDD